MRLAILLGLPWFAHAADRAALMKLHRGGTLNLSSYQASGTIDPQINYESDFWQIFFVTQDGLVGFRKAEGKAGVQLVPDLAEAMPRPAMADAPICFTCGAA